jgi:molybdopterin converting factor small subunit
MLVVLNGELTSLWDTHVEDQDRLDLYPPVDGG